MPAETIPLITRDLTFTPYNVNWIPGSARLCAVGSTARGTGTIAVFHMEGKQLVLSNETETATSMRCCTMGAADAHTRHLATGNFEGELQIWDTSRLEIPVASVKAHETIINMIDGCGGATRPGGPHELATCSRDGSVKVWDTRIPEKSVFNVVPSSEEARRDAWSVAFGNFNNQRLLAVGYDDGDVLLFDLGSSRYIWKTNVGSGVCSLDFADSDRLVASTLKGASVISLLGDGTLAHLPSDDNETTMWAVRHLAQDPNYFTVLGGDGKARLWSHKDTKTGPISTVSMSKHPVISCDWNRDKKGLLACCSFDQTVKVSYLDGI